MLLSEMIGNRTTTVARGDVGMGFVDDECIGVFSTDAGQQVQIGGNQRRTALDRPIILHLPGDEQAPLACRPAYVDPAADVVFGDALLNDGGAEPAGTIQYPGVEAALFDK